MVVPVQLGGGQDFSIIQRGTLCLPAVFNKLFAICADHACGSMHKLETDQELR